MLQSDDKIRVMAIKLNGKDKRDKGIRTPTQTDVLFDRTLFCFISYETILQNKKNALNDNTNIKFSLQITTFKTLC